MMRTSEAPKCRVAKLSGSCGVRARALTEWRPAPPPWAARPNCPCAWQPSIASPATQIAGTTKAHVAGTRRASQKKCARAPGPPDAPRGHVPLEENAHRLHIAAAPACPENASAGNGARVTGMGGLHDAATLRAPRGAQHCLAYITIEDTRPLVPFRKNELRRLGPAPPSGPIRICGPVRFNSISGRVVEYIIAIGATRARFPADALLSFSIAQWLRATVKDEANRRRVCFVRAVRLPCVEAI